MSVAESSTSIETRPYGTLQPSARIRFLLDLCHRDHGPWYSRLLAPLLRRYIIHHTPLPVDLSLNGINMRCVFKDNYSEKKFVFTPWRYDREERLLLRQYLGNRGVFLDIGANVGLYTLTALVAPDFRGHVYAFEPNPATRQRLVFNCQASCGRSDDPHLTVLPYGVADQNSQFVLRLDSSNLGASSISTPASTQTPAEQANSTTENGEVVIDCKPLLEVLADLQVSHIAVLKIDIEGAEDKAMAPYLREAPDSLLASLVIIENSEHLWQEDIFALLMQRGYQRILRNRMNSVFKLPAVHPPEAPVAVEPELDVAAVNPA